jgi:hypothetical protein
LLFLPIGELHSHMSKCPFFLFKISGPW